MAYDQLKQNHSLTKAGKEYLLILEWAAKENEAAVDEALRFLFDGNRAISAASVEGLILAGRTPTRASDVSIPAVLLHAYDCLLGRSEVWA